MADAIETHSRALALLQTTTIATLDDMLSPEDIAAPLRYARASQSANTGIAPARTTARAVAAKVFTGTTTS